MGHDLVPQSLKLDQCLGHLVVHSDQFARIPPGLNPDVQRPQPKISVALVQVKSGAMVLRLLSGMGHGKFMKAISLKKCRYSKSSEVQGTKTAGLVWNFCIGPSIRLARIQKVCRHCDIKKPQVCFQVKTPLISHDFKWVMGSFTSGRPHQPTLAPWILISTINQLG